jgi:hypothetical protein
MGFLRTIESPYDLVPLSPVMFVSARGAAETIVEEVA